MTKLYLAAIVLQFLAFSIEFAVLWSLTSSNTMHTLMTLGFGFAILGGAIGEVAKASENEDDEG